MATDKPQPISLADSDDELDELDGQFYPWFSFCVGKHVIHLQTPDVLDQFTPASKVNPPQSPLTSPPPPPPTATTTTTFQRPRTNTRVDALPISVPGSGAKPNLDATTELDEDELSAEFSRELAKGMESLMREIGAGEGLGPEGANDEETQRAFKAAWEKMLVEGMDGMGGNDLAGLEEFMGQDQGISRNIGGPSAPGTSAEANDFQNKIKQAMDKLKESESNLQVRVQLLP